MNYAENRAQQAAKQARNATGVKLAGAFAPSLDGEAVPAAGRSINTKPKTGNAKVTDDATAVILNSFPDAHRVELGWDVNDTSCRHILWVLDKKDDPIVAFTELDKDFEELDEVLRELDGSKMQAGGKWSKGAGERWSLTVGKEQKPAPVEPLRPPLTDQQRWTNRLRGQNFLPPKAVLKKVPALGSTRHIPDDERTVHLHYYPRSGTGDFYISEYDPATGMAWGHADLTGQTPEWGPINMVQLEQLHVGHTVIEREYVFSPKTLPEAVKNRR